MNPTHLHPAFAMNLGYDVDAMNDTEKVTVVRRRVVYEELVMSKEEFAQMNQKIANWDDDFYLRELEMDDIGLPDFTEEETQYTAFPGDVTSFTDDAIAFMFDEVYWTDSHEPVKIAKS